VQASRSGLLALFVVYFVWGSSFLAIRLAVSGGGAFAPFALAAVRTLAAGFLLLGVSLARGHSLRVGWPAFRWLAFTGTLLWVGGHALVIWSERRLESGLAALLFASAPLWAALLEGARGAPWAPERILSVLAGFAGVALVLPLHGSSLAGGHWVEGAALLLSAFFWALGTVAGEGPAKGLPLTVTTGVQLAVAGAVTLAWSVHAREAWATPGPRALFACGYLVVVATVLAYAAYSHAQRTLPVPWLMSFAYVNPVVAVALGALLAGERLGPRAAMGAAVVVGSVVFLLAGPALVARTRSIP
jgi:drug/metabolite transporter (DMT)-like permease